MTAEKPSILRVIQDYQAIELTIHVGDLLSVDKMESGFYWVTDRLGQTGWVPVTHVEPYRRQESEEI